MFMKLKRLTMISLSICMLWTTNVLADTEFSSLEERMTGAEFTSSGLDKLSAEELARLNQWISGHSVAQFQNTSATGSKYAASAAAGYSEAENNFQKNETIYSRLKGESTGWKNSTVFNLENGMVWVMDEKDTFYMKAEENPEITIRSGMFKTWNLSIGGHNSAVKVKRIR